MHSRHWLERAVLTLALGVSPVAAQDCVDEYLELRSGTEYLTGCTLSSAPCAYPAFDVHRVAGGGAALQAAISNLAFTTSRYTVIDVGPDVMPAVQEVYDPISVPAAGFLSGLAIVARWGPTKAAIDGGTGAQCVVVDGAGNDGPIRIGAAANRLVLGDPVLADYSGWYGFEIRRGPARDPNPTDRRRGRRLR